MNLENCRKVNIVLKMMIIFIDPLYFIALTCDTPINIYMKKITLLFFLAFSAIRLSAGTDFCGIVNTTFSHGENITFKVFYSVIGIYVDAGDASFTVNRTRFNNKPVYHIVGLGNSNPRYDWIFKVRDRYESYIDTATLTAL